MAQCREETLGNMHSRYVLVRTEEELLVLLFSVIDDAEGMDRAHHLDM